MWKLLVAACALATGACACVGVARANCDATGIVCESYSSSGDCAAGEGSSYGRTDANVLGVVDVAGPSDCTRSVGFSSWDNAVNASAAGVGVGWGSFVYDDVDNGHFEGCLVHA